MHEQQPTLLRAENERELTWDREAFNTHWSEQLKDLLNQGSVSDVCVLYCIPQHTICCYVSNLQPNKMLIHCRTTSLWAWQTLAKILKRGQKTPYLKSWLPPPESRNSMPVDLRCYNCHHIQECRIVHFTVVMVEAPDCLLQESHAWIPLTSLSQGLRNFPESLWKFYVSGGKVGAITTMWYIPVRCWKQHKQLRMAFVTSDKVINSINLRGSMENPSH